MNKKNRKKLRCCPDEGKFSGYSERKVMCYLIQTKNVHYRLKKLKNNVILIYCNIEINIQSATFDFKYFHVATQTMSKKNVQWCGEFCLKVRIPQQTQLPFALQTIRLPTFFCLLCLLVPLRGHLSEDSLNVFL